MDRLVTFVASGLTGRQYAACLATTAGLLLLGHRLWGTTHA